MASVNKVILIGNLGKDPEIRTTPQGTSLARFSVATTTNWNEVYTALQQGVIDGGDDQAAAAHRDGVGQAGGGVDGAVHRVDNWSADLFMDVGADADERRARALPLIAADPTRLPDVQFSGPDVAADDDARLRFFGE